MNKECGIYKIKNMIDGKVYIGSSVNLQRRIYEHSRFLYNKVHFNKHLQSAYDKYGKINFEFEILENCKIENILEREQYYLNLYKSYDNIYGYNVCEKAGNTLGFKHSEKSKKIISEKIKEMKVNR